MANRKRLVLRITSDGCFIPLTHKLNEDGYFRKRVKINGVVQSIMYHRYTWMYHFGDIPKGYEVDHKCKTRSCCNPNHLTLLPANKHRTKDNTGRWDEYKRSALRIAHREPTRTSTSIAQEVGVSFSSVARWRRELNREGAEAIQ